MRLRRKLLLLTATAATLAAAGGLAAGLGPAAHAATCTAALNSNCGAYLYAGIPMSNGFDTYVANQNVGANGGTTETVTATDPGSWSVTANAVPYGSLSVQTFPDVQQLTNDWCGTGWGGCANQGDTPLDSLSALSVSYTETSPTDANSIYEFAPDVWSANYPSDVMFWADTHGRCDQGAFGGTTLGTFTMDGQGWTAHRYGSFGAEIILVLDGPGGSGTCAQQSSGTINIKAGFDWLTSHGFVTGPEVVTQVNTGWEVTSADNTTFAVSGYSITATVAGSTPSPTPTPAPTPTPTTTSPAPLPAPGSLSQTPHEYVNFGWGAVTGAVSYEFMLETAAGTLVKDVTVSVLHVSNVTVAADTGYQWRVRATGGAWSAWRSFTSP
jgi:hypothetical protein